MEASRRLDELEVIQRKIPSADTVLAMAATPPEGAVEINITPEEWRILVLVDGSRTVSEIGELVGLDDFSAMRTLYGLVSAGLAEVPGHAQSGAAQVAPDQAEEVAEPTPEPVQEVAPEPEPEPEPVQQVAPEPEPQPEPVQQVAPEPEPAPAPQPEPVQETRPEPEPAPEPEPVDEPMPEPLQEAQTPAVEPQPVVAEEPVQPVGEPLQDLDLADAEAEAFYNVEEPATQEAAAPAVEQQDPVWTEAVDQEPEPALQAAPDVPPFEEAEMPVEAFDAPEPGDLVAEGPASNGYEDPLASEILSPAAAPPAPEDPVAAPEEPVAPPAPEPVAEQPQAPAPEIPVSSEPAGEAARVDRIAAVRELAGLFSEGEVADTPSRTRRATAPAPEGEETPDNRKRVEDDEQVTRGLISRLIDGVKGL